MGDARARVRSWCKCTKICGHVPQFVCSRGGPQAEYATSSRCNAILNLASASHVYPAQDADRPPPNPVQILSPAWPTEQYTLVEASRYLRSRPLDEECCQQEDATRECMQLFPRTRSHPLAQAGLSGGGYTAYYWNNFDHVTTSPCISRCRSLSEFADGASSTT